jgi:hypothetical protein
MSKTNKLQQPPDKKANDIKSIYNSQKNPSVNKEYRDRARVRFHDSINPERSGVIPKQYNRKVVLKKKMHQNLETFTSSSDSDFSDNFYSDDENSQSDVSSMNMVNPGLFLDKCDKFIDNRKHERKFVEKTNDDNNFLKQFEPQKFDNRGSPSSNNGVQSGSGKDIIQRMEQERKLAAEGKFSNFGEDGDMTYGITEQSDFTHNNMKPFFKQKGAANTLRQEHAANVHQQKMEMFSGTLNKDRPDWNHKKEQAPLFNPAANIANIYGTPVMTDFYEGRYIPGKERRNEKPFQPIKVTTGLGLGTNGDAMFTRGGGDLYRVLPKTVDDLRSANKPKLSYGGVIVPGQKGDRGRVIGRQVQNKNVVKFKENCPVDLQKTFNFETHAPKMIGEVDPTTLGGANRGIKATNHVGPLKYNVDKATPDNLREKHRTPFKETFLNAEPRNVQLVEGLRAQANYNTYVPNATQSV